MSCDLRKLVSDMRKYDNSRPTPCACPFYASYWPERTSTLVHVGGNQCGLEVDLSVPCYLEIERRPVNYYTCSLMYARRPLLDSCRNIIIFTRGDARFTLAQWEQAQKGYLD
jgi:hypothetical protein